MFNRSEKNRRDGLLQGASFAALIGASLVSGVALAERLGPELGAASWALAQSDSSGVSDADKLSKAESMVSDMKEAQTAMRTLLSNNKKDFVVRDCIEKRLTSTNPLVSASQTALGELGTAISANNSAKKLSQFQKIQLSAKKVEKYLQQARECASTEADNVDLGDQVVTVEEPVELLTTKDPTNFRSPTMNGNSDGNGVTENPLDGGLLGAFNQGPGEGGASNVDFTPQPGTGQSGTGEDGFGEDVPNEDDLGGVEPIRVPNPQRPEGCCVSTFRGTSTGGTDTGDSTP